VRTTLLPRLLPGVRTALPPADRPQVLLTFDDGPVPGPTGAVLKSLAAHGARAVFFMIGERVARHPETARAVAEAGHLVGNHTHTHPMSRWPLPTAFLDEVRRCDAALREAGIDPAPLFRPPGGFLHPAGLLAARRLGLQTLHWSLDSGDWRCAEWTDPAAQARRIAGAVRAGDIVLMHDYADVSVRILAELLPLLAGRGFDLAGGAASLSGERGGGRR